MLEGRDLHARILAGHADRFAELANGFRTHTTPTQASDGGHARIIPSGHVSFVHQPQQLALAEDGVIQLESREFNLRGRMLKAGFLHQPVVDLAAVLELQRAQRARDPLDGVAEAMREVIQRVDAPVVTTTIVMRMPDADQQWIAHDHVDVRQVDLGAQYVRAVGEFTGAHATQQVEVFLDRAIAIGARRAGRVHGATSRADFFFVLRVDVRLALQHQRFGDVVQLLEIVRRVEQVVPLKAQPLHVALNRLHVLHVFRGRVRVVETQVAGAAELPGDAEVQADRLGMPHVQKAVRLRREPRGGRPTEMTIGDIVGHHLANEVATRGGGGFRTGFRSGVGHGGYREVRRSMGHANHGK